MKWSLRMTTSSELSSSFDILQVWLLKHLPAILSSSSISFLSVIAFTEPFVAAPSRNPSCFFSYLPGPLSPSCYTFGLLTTCSQLH